MPGRRAVFGITSESRALDLCGIGGGGIRPFSVLNLGDSKPSIPLTLGLTGNLPETVRLGGRGVSMLLSLENMMFSCKYPDGAW